MRSEGYSYNLISEKLGISKGTLSCWLKELPYKPNPDVVKRIQSGPHKSGMLKHNIRVAEIRKIKELAKNELGSISKRDLWMIGLGLYIGEGAKSIESVRIINSDPEIIKLSIKWLREVCGLKTSNITLAIHLYPDNDIEKSLQFWSKETRIPLAQFRKTQIDKRINKLRKNQGKLPFGTAHIRIVSDGNAEFGVKLHRRIMGWIESAYNQT